MSLEDDIARLRNDLTDAIAASADEAALDAVRVAALGKKGSQVGGLEVQQHHRIDGLPAIVAEKLDQAVRGRDISARGVRGAATVVQEIAGPTLDESARRMID